MVTNFFRFVTELENCIFCILGYKSVLWLQSLFKSLYTVTCVDYQIFKSVNIQVTKNTKISEQNQKYRACKQEHIHLKTY